MKYLICNLKAHKDYQEILNYKNYLHSLNKPLNIILAPSTLYLNLFKDEDILLCCQDISLYEQLNLTGDITIKQLLSLNVKYILVGHYERRKYYFENNESLLKKVKKALANNLKIIYCIGESKEELDKNISYQVIAHQLANILDNIPISQFKNIIIAYEPTYLIGNENKYNLNIIVKQINFIKELAKRYYHTNIDVVFGGNIMPHNIANFLNISNLDGFIIGSASLNPQNIALILDKMTQQPK